MGFGFVVEENPRHRLDLHLEKAKRGWQGRNRHQPIVGRHVPAQRYGHGSGAWRLPVVAKL